jgi:hypothetical protein
LTSDPVEPIMEVPQSLPDDCLQPGGRVSQTVEQLALVEPAQFLGGGQCPGLKDRAA